MKRRYSAIICEVDCYDDILYTLEDPEQFIKSNPSLFKNKVFILDYQLVQKILIQKNLSMIKRLRRNAMFG